MQTTIIVFILLGTLFLLFWLFSMLYATIFGSPVVYANEEAVNDCLGIAELKEGEVFLDLGSGGGQTLVLAAERGAKAYGVDRSYYCFLRSKIRAWFSGHKDNIKIIRGDFKKAEEVLKVADVVYLYLLNSTMRQIEKWVFESVKPSARVVSLAFTFDKKPQKTEETFNLGKKTKIYMYKK